MGEETVFVNSVRRQVLIDRHREAISEMEGSISNTFMAKDVDHPRLQAMLDELHEESEQQRIQSTVDLIVKDPIFSAQCLQDAIIDHLCLLRENSGIEIATLQMHCIGVYRRVNSLYEAAINHHMSITELREVSVKLLDTIIHPKEALFGSLSLSEAVPCTLARQEFVIDTIKAIRLLDHDSEWADLSNPDFLPRSLEEPLADLPDEEQAEERKFRCSDYVRSQFYRALFLDYFSIDELDPSETKDYVTILDWFCAIRDTPHLFPFMQGQSAEQKNYRLIKLIDKFIQINELYQRVEDGRTKSAFHRQFPELTSREILKLLAKEKYPPMKVDEVFITSTLLCPFSAFVNWIQEKHATVDFVLPPEPQRRSPNSESARQVRR